MLASSPVVAVVAVRNMDSAKEFYEGTLELKSAGMDDPGGVFYACGGGSLLLVYESSYAGTNEATAVSWEVSDIRAEVAEMKGKGVTFEQYDLPGMTRDGDVHVADTLSAAWFKDPDGNILALVMR